MDILNIYKYIFEKLFNSKVSLAVILKGFSDRNQT